MISTFKTLSTHYYSTSSLERLEAQGLDKPTFDVSSSLGVNLVETKLVDTQPATKGQMTASSSRAHTHLGDEPWDLDKMLKRNALVEVFQWSTSDTTNAPVVDYTVPFSLLRTAIQQVPFQRFLYWRGTIRVRFQLNASRFHQGRLIAFYVPLQTPQQDNAFQALDRTWQTQLQHVFIDPANNTVCELEIPFIHPKSWISLVDDQDYLGTIHVHVFNPLIAAVGVSSTVNVSVIVSMDNEFQVPVVAGSAPAIQAQGLFDVVKKAGSEAVDGAWNKIAKAIRPSEIIGDVFDVAKLASAMDKPNDTVQPDYLVRKPLGYFNHAQQIEHLEKLNMYPGALNMCDHEHFGTEADEMDLHYLMSIPAFHTSDYWTEAYPSDTILATGHIQPMSILARAAPYTSLNNQYALGPMEYFSTKFNFWRGGIKIRIDIVANQFVTGRLWFGTHYGSYVPANLNAASSQFGQMIDVADGKTSHEIILPFRSDTPWKRIPNGPLPDPGLGGSTPYWYSIYSLGTWSLRVVNPLIVPAGVPGSVAFNIFISAADDYEVNFLGTNNLTAGVAGDSLPAPAEFIFEEQMSMDVEAQGQDTHGDAEDGTPNDMAAESSEVNSESLGPSRSIAKPNAHFTERYTSVRDILKRYHPIRRFAGVPSDFPNEAYISQGLFINYLSIPVEDLLRTDSLFKWFASPFRLFRGSLRFKFVIRFASATSTPNFSSDFSGFVWHDTTNVPYIGTVPPTDVAYNSSATLAVAPKPLIPVITPSPSLYKPNENIGHEQGAPLAYFTQQCPYAEFEIPFVTLYNSNPNPSALNFKNNLMVPTQSLGKLNLMMNAIDRPFQIDVYMGIGDDARFGVFASTPPVFLYSMTGTDPDLRYPYLNDKYVQ